MNLLKRELAPILPEAWAAIDRIAKSVLELGMAGRKLVDFKGPSGWQYAAVNRGRLALLDREPVEGVRAGLRLVMPLVELRIPIVLDIMELDGLGRGADDPDLDPVIRAAEKIARVEDTAIFGGYPDAGITGILQASPHKHVKIPPGGPGYIDAIVEAKEALRAAGVNGPYALVLGSRGYDELSRATEDGYPTRKRVEQQILDGPLVWSPAIQNGAVLSVRGGDFELTVGQDLSIGYADRDRQHVELYLTESFTFRVLEPTAAIVLDHSTP